MNNWLKDHGHQWISSQKKWFNKLTTQLDLPIKEGALRDGYATVEFDIERVYKHLIERRWVEGGCIDVDEEVSPMDQTEVNSFFDF